MYTHLPSPIQKTFSRRLEPSSPAAHLINHHPSPEFEPLQPADNNASQTENCGAARRAFVLPVKGHAQEHLRHRHLHRKRACRPEHPRLWCKTSHSIYSELTLTYKCSAGRRCHLLELVGRDAPPSVRRTHRHHFPSHKCCILTLSRQ